MALALQKERGNLRSQDNWADPQWPRLAGSFRALADELMRRGAVRDGGLVIITKGDLAGVHGATNAMKIIRVGEHGVEEAN